MQTAMAWRLRQRRRLTAGGCPIQSQSRMYLMDGLEALFERHQVAAGDVLRFARLPGTDGEVVATVRRAAAGDAPPRTRRIGDAQLAARAGKVPPLL